MKIEVGENREIVLKEVYSGVLLETIEGNKIGICMRDDTFEINVIPKGGMKSVWHGVDMKTANIYYMGGSVDESDDRTDPVDVPETNSP